MTEEEYEITHYSGKQTEELHISEIDCEQDVDEDYLQILT